MFKKVYVEKIKNKEKHIQIENDINGVVIFIHNKEYKISPSNKGILISEINCEKINIIPYEHSTIEII